MCCCCWVCDCAVASGPSACLQLVTNRFNQQQISKSDHCSKANSIDQSIAFVQNIAVDCAMRASFLLKSKSIPSLCCSFPFHSFWSQQKKEIVGCICIPPAVRTPSFLDSSVFHLGLNNKRMTLLRVNWTKLKSQLSLLGTERQKLENCTWQCMLFPFCPLVSLLAVTFEAKTESQHCVLSCPHNVWWLCMSLHLTCMHQHFHVGTIP